jgi:hypothetical protein
MSTSTARVRRHRDRERRDEIVLMISVNRTALVDRLINGRLLRPGMDHDHSAIVSATEQMVRRLSMEKS